MILGQNISFTIGSKPILQNVNITVEPNKIIGLAGMNGAGKSTLLKVLSGQHKKYNGNLLYNSSDIKSFSLQQLASLRSVLPQSTTTAFSVNGRAIIEMGRLFFNEPDNVKKHVYEEVIEVVKCKHLLNQPYETMSGGEKQRVQLARVLAQIWLGNHPRYLFLDEPISALDIAIQHEVMSLLNVVKHKNIGVLVILHDINLMLQYCDDVCFLRNGEVVAKGNSQEMFDAELLSEIFNVPFQIIASDNHNWIVPNAQQKSISEENFLKLENV